MSDAGEIAGRQSVTLSWAVPRRSRSATGQLWAYFPTSSRTTLTGIINAPFKTNEDRHDILNGTYNRELLQSVLPGLVADALPSLVDTDDPGSIFDILPARGREARSWADDALNIPVMTAVAGSRCIPDLDGALQRPSDVALTPRILSEHPRWAHKWSAVPGLPNSWIHPSVDRGGDRRAKATRLFDMVGREESSVKDWLEAAAATSSVGSMVAIQLASVVERSESVLASDVRAARIILTASGNLTAPRAGHIFFPSGAQDRGERFAASELVADRDTIAALTELGITPLDAAGQLHAHIAEMADVRSERAVDRLWSLVRGMDQETAAAVVDHSFGRGGVPVRTLAGRAAALRDTFLPGTVVPSDGTRDADVTLDIRYHADDLELLGQLGSLNGPRPPKAGVPDESWYEEWATFAVNRYLAEASRQSRRLRPAQVSIRSGRTASGIGLLPRLSSTGKAALSREILGFGGECWSVGADTRNAPPPIRVANPALWWVRRHGVVKTSFGLVAVEEAVAPTPGIPDDLLPVPVELNADAIGLLGLEPASGVDAWRKLVARGETSLQPEPLASLYAAAARAGMSRPRHLRVGAAGERVPASEVAVTCDRPTWSLLSGVRDVLLTDERDLETLLEYWHLVDARCAGEAISSSRRLGRRYLGARAVPGSPRDRGRTTRGSGADSMLRSGRRDDDE